MSYFWGWLGLAQRARSLLHLVAATVHLVRLARGRLPGLHLPTRSGGAALPRGLRMPTESS